MSRDSELGGIFGRARVLRIYGAPRPDSADAAIGDAPLLAVVRVSAKGPAAPDAAGVRMDLSCEEAPAAASGVAEFARMSDADGADICDLSVGDCSTSFRGEVRLPDGIRLTAGKPVRVDGITIRIIDG